MPPPAPRSLPAAICGAANRSLSGRSAKGANARRQSTKPSWARRCCRGSEPEAGVLRRDAVLVWRGLAQHIAAAPHRLDIVAPARRRRQLLAQFADENVDDFELRLVHAAIEMVEEH